jgi:hypothetical protein
MISVLFSGCSVKLNMTKSRIAENFGLCHKTGKISGGDSEGDPPVPIPNTAVKPFSADDTWGETPWESRSLPDSIFKSQESFSPAIFLFGGKESALLRSTNSFL